MGATKLNHIPSRECNYPGPPQCLAKQKCGMTSEWLFWGYLPAIGSWHLSRLGYSVSNGLSKQATLQNVPLKPGPLLLFVGPVSMARPRKNRVGFTSVCSSPLEKHENIFPVAKSIPFKTSRIKTSSFGWSKIGTQNGSWFSFHFDPHSVQQMEGCRKATCSKFEADHSGGQRGGLRGRPKALTSLAHKSPQGR